MIHPINRFMLVAIAVAASVLGQGANPNAIVGAGYLVPAPINLVPGQVITVFAIGVGSGLTQPVFAGPGKLPTSLAGIGVTVAQETNLAAPILVVSPAPRCPNCTVMTAITIQVPYELEQYPAGGGLFQTVELFVTENGVAGNWSLVSPGPDQIHILTTCDTVFGSLSGPSTGGCPWEVTHADGSLVSNTNPASAGEVLTAYAVGLGATNPAVPTGEPAAQPTPTAKTIRMGFDFQPNAPPSRPPSLAPAPLYAGLTPGFAGLYQINFIVPSIPAGLPPCYSDQGTTFVNTNLTVSIEANSFDGAEICVSVPK